MSLVKFLSASTLSPMQCWTLIAAALVFVFVAMRAIKHVEDQLLSQIEGLKKENIDLACRITVVEAYTALGSPVPPPAAQASH